MVLWKCNLSQNTLVHTVIDKGLNLHVDSINLPNLRLEGIAFESLKSANIKGEKTYVDENIERI